MRDVLKTLPLLFVMTLEMFVSANTLRPRKQLHQAKKAEEQNVGEPNSEAPKNKLYEIAFSGKPLRLLVT